MLAKLRALDGEAVKGLELSDIEPAWRDIAELAQTLYRIRRYRDAAFDRGLFADPGWDMLLDLFASMRDGVSVKSLCAASIRPSTSGLRVLERLIDADLVRRVPDQRDRRQILIVPTVKATAAMETIYVQAVNDARVRQANQCR